MEMKLNFVLVLIFIWTFNTVDGTLEPCIKSVQSKVCLLVDDSQDYVSTVNPEPLPTQVDIILSVFDIIDVNEAQQTVKLMFKIILEWQDYRMDVNRTKEDVTRYQQGGRSMMLFFDA